MKLSFVFYFLLVFSILSSCRKDVTFPASSGTLSFSADTLTFDTVFTSVGSITGAIKVYNPHKGKVMVNSIRLGGGQNSAFRINVDGTPVNTIARDIEIAPKDSLYVFVKVTVDPNNQNTPFIMMDSIIFETNSGLQYVQLMAWGQNAHFFKSDTLSCNTVWNNDKPYVIMNYVLVDSTCLLTINPGVKVFLHPGAALLIKGTLKANGTKTDSVVFQGDRLEYWFDDLPGQWNGIYLLRGSTQNDINYTIVKNSVDGVNAGGILAGDSDMVISNLNIPDVKVSNTIIKNSLAAGIAGFWADIEATNCLIYNSGGYNVLTTLGGDGKYTHCTFVNYGSVLSGHKTAVVGLSNYFASRGPVNMNITFTNCIIYGTLEEEVDTAAKSGADFNYVLTNCLVKTKRTVNASNIKNDDPVFADISKNDFHLKNSSPAINKGILTAVTADLDGKLRDNLPDIGAYEYSP